MNPINNIPKIEVDFRKVKEICNKLKKKLLKKHPGVHHTIIIKLWDDNTYQIICKTVQREENGKLMTKEYTWFRDEIKYNEYM